MTITITEPTTLITDYLLAAMVGYWALRLFLSAGQPRRMTALLWSGAFLASALAAATGGTVHGFALVLAPGLKGALWKVTVYAIGLAGLLFLCAAATETLTPRGRRWVVALAVVKFAVFAVWMANHDAFRYVILDYAPSLVAVLVLEIWASLRRRSPEALWIVAGILLSFVAAAVQMSGLALHRHFNHNDLYHLLQLGAFALLYQGARRGGATLVQ